MASLSGLDFGEIMAAGLPRAARSEHRESAMGSGKDGDGATTYNMTWVIGRGGRVAYKANWTSAANVEAFLIRFLAARAKHPPATTAVMYETAG
jgi:hypothetical protein